jgi:hypothetical protein
MMGQLPISSLRPGADGFNGQAPNAQNTDEAKAKRYSVLPDPLVLKNGRKVTSANLWWKQHRPEIAEEFNTFWAAKVRELQIVPSNPRLVTAESEQQGVYYQSVTLAAKEVGDGLSQGWLACDEYYGARHPDRSGGAVL